MPKPVRAALEAATMMLAVGMATMRPIAIIAVALRSAMPAAVSAATTKKMIFVRKSFPLGSCSWCRRSRLRRHR
ncbi:hypothetical protein ACFWY5_12175 [Nonomuraea sp. NPDC059007]|uniref:hypothetical protein n=1 Tax=Nonomuraea sp. NPDC059007 TaxID=3346692 RepID=UPI0036CC629A